MTDINEFNITDEELREIEQITELAQDCTNNLIDCLVDPDTEEKVELDEEDKKDMYKFILDIIYQMMKVILRSILSL